MKTFSAKPEEVRRDWYVVDATDKVLGRLAAEVSRRLHGKHKPEFTPHVDTGDYIVVVNVDKLRVTGYLRLPRTPDEPMWLVVTELAVLETAPELSAPAAVATAVIERYGPYVCYFDADVPEVEVFTETGVRVGTAPTPDEIGDLLHVFEQRQAASGE